MSDSPKLQGPDGPNDDLREGPAVGIADIVEAQKGVVDEWARYATRSLNRVQTGDFEIGGWSHDLGRVIRETSIGAVRVLGALARLRTGR